MASPFDCMVCFLPFSTDRQPMLISCPCSATLCKICLDEIKVTRNECPKCRGSFQNCNLNRQLLDIIDFQSRSKPSEAAPSLPPVVAKFEEKSAPTEKTADLNRIENVDVRFDVQLRRPCLQFFPELNPASDALLHLSLRIPDFPGIKGRLVICVIDCSGSMGVNTDVYMGDQKKQTCEANVLDVVKHAVVSIIESMSPEDGLSVIGYHTEITTYGGGGADAVLMGSSENRSRAKQFVYELRADGQTNALMGIEAALKIADEETRPGVGRFSRAAVFVLTDGQANMVPFKFIKGSSRSEGEITLIESAAMMRPLQGRVTMQSIAFGYGNGLDSKLTYELAHASNGCAHHIPDITFTNNIISNMYANDVATMLTGIAFQIEISDSDTGAAISKTEWKVASLQFGQSKDIVVHLPNVSAEKLTVSVTTIDGSGHRRAATFGPLHVNANSGVIDTNLIAIAAHYYRQNIAKFLQKVFREAHVLARRYGANAQMETLRKDSEATLHDFATNLKRVLSHISPQLIEQDNCAKLLAGLRLDLVGRSEESGNAADAGEVEKGLASNEALCRWGVHYFAALSSAHEMQVCNNSKDHGVKLYGMEGSRLRHCEEMMHRFSEIPLIIQGPPVPVYASGKSNLIFGGAAVGPDAFLGPAPRTLNAALLHSNGPCFEGSCTVALADGKQKLIQDVRKGDLLATAGKPRPVLCVVRTLLEPTNPIVILPGIEGGAELKVTPWHPIRVDKKVWTFSHDVEACTVGQLNSNYVYSLLLDDAFGDDSVILVNNYECATWRHHISGPVIEHAFWGTDRILTTLQGMVGWADGLVDLKSGCVVKEGGVAVGLVQ